MNATIIGHDIIINKDLNNTDFDSAVDTINNKILEGNDSGDFELENGCLVGWYIAPNTSLSYLEEKVYTLEKTDEVSFEYNQKIYKAYKRSDGDYEIERHDLESLLDGEIDAEDCGFFKGTAREAIEDALEITLPETEVKNLCNIIKTAYKPPFSKEAMQHLKDVCVPEYENEDNQQYQIDNIIQNIDKAILPACDLEILNKLESNGIDYIEL